MPDRPLEYRPHPWHGLDPGIRFPEIVRAYIEIVPTDGVKYEIDKHSGYLMVDRPQRFSTFARRFTGSCRAPIAGIGLLRTDWRAARPCLTATAIHSTSAC